MITARAEAIQQSKLLLSLQPLYLDTETTGLDHRSEIIEVAIVSHDGLVLFQSLVKPTQPIPPDAFRIHRISDDMVYQSPKWPEIWPEILTLINDRHVGIYNADFDLRILQQTHRKYRMPWQLGAQTNFFCIMKLYAQFYGQWDRRKSSYRFQSLDLAGKQCQLTLPNSHRAVDDTLLARAVLHHMASTNI